MTQIDDKQAFVSQVKDKETYMMNIDQILGKKKDVSDVPKKRFDEKSTKAGAEINRLTDMIHDNINVSYIHNYNTILGSGR